MADKMLQQIKKVEELQSYCEAQFNTINDLNQKLSKLEAENRHLKVLLDATVPQNGETAKLEVTDEETICRTQLKLLSEKAMLGELTLEESRKTEIYTKILQSLLNKPKTVVVETKNLANEDLLAILEAPNGKS